MITKFLNGLAWEKYLRVARCIKHIMVRTFMAKGLVRQTVYTQRNHSWCCRWSCISRDEQSGYSLTGQAAIFLCGVGKIGSSMTFSTLFIQVNFHQRWSKAANNIIKMMFGTFIAALCFGCLPHFNADEKEPEKWS